jgi:hypothetical protein
MSECAARPLNRDDVLDRAAFAACLVFTGHGMAGGITRADLWRAVARAVLGEFGIATAPGWYARSGKWADLHFVLGPTTLCGHFVDRTTRLVAAFDGSRCRSCAVGVYSMGLDEHG